MGTAAQGVDPDEDVYMPEKMFDNVSGSTLLPRPHIPFND